MDFGIWVLIAYLLIAALCVIRYCGKAIKKYGLTFECVLIGLLWPWVLITFIKAIVQDEIKHEKE